MNTDKKLSKILTNEIQQHFKRISPKNVVNIGKSMLYITFILFMEISRQEC